MSIDYSDMAFPKPRKKKKRKIHKKSILNSQKGICYLCARLNGDYSVKQTEEHHILFGAGQRAISEEKGWLPYVTGCNWSDANNGYAGYPGAVIDAVEVYYDTPADIVAKYGYQKAQYRVAPIGGGYYPWQFDNETGNGQDGHAGCFGIAFDKFQLY